ncbi:endolytic transglycosylase MltG [Brevibacillus sp. SYSU BS000544]|uniref:endolytic transglycosylase MltG n=1 Tax=Brevibacillus sp. SYSU BS000544 TaxID=3416443 RepID=UPI003CE54E97
MNQVKKEREKTPMQITKNKRRNRPIKLMLWGILLLLLVVGISASYVYSQLQAPAASGSTPVNVTIPSGSSVREIGDILQKEGLIKNAALFSLYVRTKDVGNRLQAGNYHFQRGQSLDTLLESMASGEVVMQTTRFTIPEGWNVEQIAKGLADKGIVNKEKFLQEVNKGDFSDYAFVKSIPVKEGRKYRLEGYLFPETYEVKKGASEHEVIAKMLSQFQKEVKPEWITQLQKRDLSLDEAVTLASIVEREVVVDEERPVVAGVFFNRIRDNWMLQSCATVQFILGKQRDRITFDDLKIESPYNTYLNPGLPPGPIASPGRASLAAVVQPAKHDFFFFVTKKDGSSQHFFSKTLEEHMARDAKSRGNW